MLLIKKINSLINLFLLLLIIIPSLTIANINYQGEHNNYGDQAKIRQHVKNHLKDQYVENLTDDDELYYLFSIHDVNQDAHLDGHELREAFIDSEGPPATIEEIIEMIDHALLEDDMDNDGKISWEEYLLSQSYHKAN